MRKNWMVGNWKLHGTREGVKSFLNRMRDHLQSNPLHASTEVMVALPFVYLWMAADSPIPLAAQNLSQHVEGAYTGEVSAAMLRDCGVKAAIVGHSERRAQHGETHESIAQKVLAAQANRLLPILCIGESLAERQSGDAELSCAKQLQILKQSGGSAAFRRLILAYEPVWAIGTGEAARLDVIEAMHQFLRQELERLAPDEAEEISLLYGGSVKPENAKAIFSSDWIDGVLVGNASLDAAQFLSMLSELEKQKAFKRSAS